MELSAFRSHRSRGDIASPGTTISPFTFVRAWSSLEIQPREIHRESYMQNTDVVVTFHETVFSKTISPGGQVFTDVDAQGKTNRYHLSRSSLVAWPRS